MLLEVRGGTANGIGQTTRLIPGRGQCFNTGCGTFIFSRDYLTTIWPYYNRVTGGNCFFNFVRFGATLCQQSRASHYHLSTTCKFVYLGGVT